MRRAGNISPKITVHGKYALVKYEPGMSLRALLQIYGISDKRTDLVRSLLSGNNLAYNHTTLTLLWHREDTTPYECDGLTAYRERPLVVACRKPMSRCRPCCAPATMDVPVVARGAGTGLSAEPCHTPWGSRCPWPSSTKS
jgi:hypothetical protein